MYFIEFYGIDTKNTVRAAVGDRSVIILDGRESSWKHHNIARSEGKRRGFPFYKICRGDSFTRVAGRTTLHSTGV